MVLSQRARLWVAIAAPIVVFGGTELGLRLAGFEFAPRELPIRVWNANEDEEMTSESSLHRVDADTLWGLRPGATVLEGRDETVNAAGYRGPLVDARAPPGSLRVALLGESAVFGFQVPHEDTLGAQLELLLEEAGQPAEVVNAAVTGYTIRQGIERYRALVRPLRPDVVVASFGATNESAPSKDRDDAAKLRHLHQSAGGLGSFALALRRNVRIAHLLSWFAAADYGGEAVQQRAAKRFGQERAENHAARDVYGQVDWDGQRRVGLADYGRALIELQAEVEADGARLILCCMPRSPSVERDRPVITHYNLQQRSFARDRDLQHLDMRAVLRDEIAAGVDPVDWFLEGNRIHPNAYGHRRIAEELLPMVLDGEVGRPPSDTASGDGD
jgi:lysophospholipase L1-like esterase